MPAPSASTAWPPTTAASSRNPATNFSRPGLRCPNENGEVQGLGVIRACRAASRIGPLYAASSGIAAALVSGLATKAGATAVAIDIPDCNEPAVRLAEQMGLKPAFETARMYTGPAPAVAYAGLFGVTSLELG